MSHTSYMIAVKTDPNFGRKVLQDIRIHDEQACKGFSVEQKKPKQK